jgi:hypothetical protein
VPGHQAALDAIRHWEFEPARLGGKPIRMGRGTAGKIQAFALMLFYNSLYPSTIGAHTFCHGGAPDVDWIYIFK